MAKFLNNAGLSRLISKIKAALNNKIDKVTSTDNAVVRFDGTSGNVLNSGVTINDSNHITATKFITSGGTSSQLVKGDGSLETSDNYVKYADTSYINVETVSFKSKNRTFGGSGWYRIYQGYYTPVHIMLTRGYNSPAPEGYDLDIETYDVTLTDDLWGIATITQNAGYYNSADNQEILKIRVYGYNGAPSANPNNTDKSKLCIDVYINDRNERYNNVYDVSGYCLQRGTTISGRFFNYAELTADNIEYATFCQNFGNSKYYLEFTLVNGFKTNKSAHAQSFIKDGGTSSQFLLGDGSVTTLKTVNSTSLLGSGNVAVQPTLVSGTNIKTINNTSLLGSGNISVQTPLTFDSTPTANSTNPVTSGGIKTALDAKKGIVDIVSPSTPDGTFVVLLDNGDDITVDFNHSHPQYQETLVSGTNIKTINNNSLLGSGNINVVSDVKLDNVSLVTNNIANIPHDILQLDGWDFDSDIGGSSITDAQYNTIVLAAADHKLIKIGDTLVTVREDTDTDYYIICGITPNDGAGELAVKALKVTKQSYSGEHYLANGGLISGSTIEQQILMDLANYLPLSGGTMSGAIKFPRTSSAMDNTSGINFINGNTTTAHIGDDTNNSLGIYSNGKIILRPNGASSSATSNGSITIDNSGVIVNENITAEKFITSGGTSSQFVKGDGSLDSTSYATSSSLSDYVTLNTSQSITGRKQLELYGDGRHFYNVCNVANRFDNKKHFVIYTSIRYMNQMPVVTFKGFNYPNYDMESKLTFYIYQNEFYIPRVQNLGAYNPTIYLFAYDDNGVTRVAIGLEGSFYFFGVQLDVHFPSLGFELEGSLPTSQWTYVSDNITYTDETPLTDRLIPPIGTDHCVKVPNNQLATTTTGNIAKVSSTDNAIVRFDGTAGAVQNSSAKVTDDGSVSVKNVVIHGSNTSNDTRIITSDAANNIYVQIGTMFPFAITDQDIRPGSNGADVINLGNTSRYWNNVYAKKYIVKNGTSSQFLKADGSVDSTSYAPLSSPTFTGTPKAPTATLGTNTTQIATTAFVQAAIDALPEPMVFKGSLGTGGTITSLPVNGTADVGDTYKVITDGTYAGKAAKVGDTFICLTKTLSANTWELIPSGDEPSGTVTSVGMTVPTGLSVSGSPITSSGTLAVTYASGYSIPTTTKQGLWDTAYSNNHTHSNKSVLDGISSSDITNWNGKANIASPTFTGTPAAPTATAGTNTTLIATTAFVQTAVNNKVHYIANLLAETTANYITEPEFKSVKINGSSTNAASSSNCVLLYDTTNECLKFIFN